MKTLVVGLFITLLVVIQQSKTDPWSAKSSISGWAKPSPEIVYASSYGVIEGNKASNFMEVSWTHSSNNASYGVSENNARLDADIKNACDELKEKGDIRSYNDFCLD